ncbi:transposase [Mycoplasmopsis columboralis]|uniref:Transposase n=2 Tax=Mycoplasmopsis columboralis TaxID=171282 RepID=A0A449B688_9BACT|nr:IS30 family transposase [Mycoplasmopsis columboralis]VEU76062.1 transposase [Mycoplasmopsis columboralis]
MLKNNEYSFNEIADKLKIHRISLYHEIKKNSDLYGYIACSAQNKHDIRRQWSEQIKLRNTFEKYLEFSKLFLSKFDKKTWGVEVTYLVITNNYPEVNHPSLRTVFNWINSGIWVITRDDRLRKIYKKGRKRYISAVERLVGKRWVVPYWARPSKIDDRTDFGHWELDLIVGKTGLKQNHLLTFVERKSRFGLIKKVYSKDPWKILITLWDLIKEYRLNVKSITTDNGFEFNKLFYLGYRLKIKIYLTDPYASFEKGTIEHYNGIVRRFFKKRTNFNSVSDEKIKEILDKINQMPRKIHGYLSADEMFFDLNYYKEKWNPIPMEEKLFTKIQRRRPSNTSRNKFFKNKY